MSVTPYIVSAVVVLFMWARLVQQRLRHDEVKNLMQIGYNLLHQLSERQDDVIKMLEQHNEELDKQIKAFNQRIDHIGRN